MIALSLRDRSAVAVGNSRIFGEDKKIEQKYSAEAGGKLQVNSEIGSISIVGTDRNEVAIIVYARGNEEELDKFSVKMDQNGNTINIDGRYSRSHFRWFNNEWIEVAFEIEVPRKFNLDLQTSGGNIEVENLEGDIEGETSGGNLTCEDVSGTVRMETSGGNVDIRRVSGDFNLETSGGNMFAQEVTGPLHMETSGGNIDVRECDGKLYASTSGGNIRASLKSNQGIDLSTSGGNIAIRIPSTITADVHAEASGGDVSCELEYSGKIKEGSMKGKINGGGNIIQLETSGGDITIDSYD
jgi:DUF4097 and DUF4098 domain-containing protein YvlB